MPFTADETHPGSVLFVFLDGVGIGPGTPTNPFSRLKLPAFEQLAGDNRWIEGTPAIRKPNHSFHSVDATLGVDGLPQSGTGQATLFSGTNCAGLAGRHFGPFPHSTSRSIITHSNVFSKLSAIYPDYRPAFANAYPERFFQYVDRTNRWTVTTLCCLEAGVRLRTYKDWQLGRAITADLTAEGWLSLGYDLDPISIETAADRLCELTRTKGFTLFEYFYTDKAGHSLSMERAEEVLRTLDVFFSRLLERWDPGNELLLISSDHGNIEDMLVKSHTRSPVPLVAYGPGAGRFASAESIADVVPILLETVAG